MGTLAGRSTQQDHDGSTNGPHPEGRCSAVVVGAGITGLTAAHALRQQGVSVVVLDAAPQAGGVMRTTHADGFVAEHGPNSFVSSPVVEQLLTALDLQQDVVEPDAAANKRYVVRDGELHAFPLTPPAMLSTRLLSTKAKLRVLLEPLVPRYRGPGEESIAAFVRRRLGREVLDYAVDPFVSGIFAGDPDTLSMAHAFPRVTELEMLHGSLSRGLMAQRRRAASAPAGSTTTSSSPASPARLVSFVDGMQTLPDALAAALGPSLQLSRPLRHLHADGGRWVVETGDAPNAQTLIADTVVLATPAHALAAMELPAALRRHAAPIEHVSYPPVSTLTLGFTRQQVAHALDGFGMLVPRVEQRRVLGVLFSSSLFPARAPEGHVTLTVFVGGARNPQQAALNTEALLPEVLRDLHDLLGVTGSPVYTHHAYWPRAIPQYLLGYQEVKDAVARTETEHPGLYLAGNYHLGVSVGDCVANGVLTAERVASYLGRTA
jgi:protoporphyrinogen/coproporphyrinogen III oxidase